MKVHTREKQDGLAEKIQTSASVAMVCPFIASKDYMAVDDKVIAKILANSPSNPDQSDLYYLNSILVSTGWNKNTDVFLKDHVWAARSTPTDKQFNFMHDETNIIGHITGSIVLDRDGNVVSGEEAPDEFDIVTSAVIYRAISDPEKRFEREQIIAEIEQRKWAVSMEALFSDFDYAVITPEGEHKIIARDEESAFLTKHLKAYGGDGEFDGFLLGRVLKNITFSGKGLVDNPAGPRSVILDKNVNPFKAVSSLDIKTFTKTEKTMNEDMLKQEIADLKRELAEFKASAAKAEEVARAKQAAEAEAKTAELTSTIEEKDEAIASLTSDVETVKTEKDAVVAEAKKLQENLDNIEAQVKQSNRKSALVEAGLKGDEVDETLAKFEKASEEVFADVVELLKSKKDAEAKFEKFEKKDDEDEDDKDKKDKKKADAADEAADEVDEAEAEEAEAALKDEEDDEKQSAVAHAIAYLESSVFKSTANLKD